MIDDMIAVLHVVYVYTGMYYMYICPADNICLYVHHSIISQPNWLKFYKHLENNMQFHHGLNLCKFVDTFKDISTYI